MVPWTAGALAEVIGGAVRGDARAIGAAIVTDSRAGVRPGDVFFGLVGPHFDGAAFAADALADGASIVVVRAPGPLVVPAGRAVVEVDDPLVALQALAAEARRRFGGVVVGVTGSNGKTATKDLLGRALAGARRVSVSPLSYNSQVGVALSLLHVDPDADVAVIECGISRPGEMARLAAMVRPDVGVLVNIGDAHAEGLGDLSTTAREKARLFAPGTLVFVPVGERLACAALEAAGAVPVRVGEGAWRLEWATLHTAAGPVALGVDPGSDVFLRDAALAAAAAVHLGVPPEVVAAGLADWTPPPMRLEVLTTARGVIVINDAYTSDPESVAGALRMLVHDKGAGRTLAVLGGMAELGPGRAAAHARVGGWIVDRGVDRLIGVGEGGAEIVAAARLAGLPAERAATVAEPTEAAPLVEAWARAGDRVLLKASRYERLERAAEALFGGLSSARLTVDLDAIVENHRVIRRAVPRGVAVLAVVKSFGYGLDGARIAGALQAAGVECFSVAYPDEGIALRDAGITRPILVHNVVPAEAGKVVARGLSAEVWTEETVAALSEAAARHQRVVRVHLKVDSGMGRAGCLAGEAVALARRITEDPGLILDGLMTHFAASEDPAADDTTREQIASFRATVDAVSAAVGRPRWVHACNSAAIERFPEAHFDLVRAGLGLLGYTRVGGSAVAGQQPVLRLTTRVVSVRTLPAGRAVGYNATWSTGDHPRTIALVALGYGDGYPWALGNKGWMVVRGVTCPVVGRVSMDVTTLDVTAALGVAVGDEVVVFGPGPGEPEVEALAAAAGTISYELLTRLSARVRRVYLGSRAG